MERSERSGGARTGNVSEHDSECFDGVEHSRSSGLYGGDHTLEAGEERDFARTVGSIKTGLGLDEGRSGTGHTIRDSSGNYFERFGKETYDPLKSPSSKTAGTGMCAKEKFKICPRSSERDGVAELLKGVPRKDCGLEKDCEISPRKSLHLEKGGTEAQTFSPRKDRDLDMHRASPKSKVRSNREEGKAGCSGKGHGSSSDEGDKMTCNKVSSSKTFGWRQDAVEKRRPAGENSLEEEEWRKRSPDTPSPFFHIAKRHRSERDRGRLEESSKAQSSKDAHLPGQEMADSHNTLLLEQLGTVQEENIVGARNLSCNAMDQAEELQQVSLGNLYGTDAQSDENLLEKGEDLQVPDSFSSPGEQSEMEEGELEPEGIIVEEKQEDLNPKDSDGERTDTDLEEEGKGGDSEVHRHVTMGEAGCNGLPMEAFEAECQPNVGGSEALEDQQVFCKRSDHGEAQKMVEMIQQHGIVRDTEDEADLQMQHKASKEFGIGESSQGVSTRDLPREKVSAEKMTVEQWDPEIREKDLDASRALTLSLFTKPAGADAEIPKQGGHTTGVHGTLNEKFESGKQLSAVQSTQVRMSEKCSVRQCEESGEPSSTGNKQKELKMDSLQLSLALPGTPMEPAGSDLPRLACPVESERTFQSLTQTLTQNLSQTQTHSDGFTTSLSFSQSQSFVHNPSCSLNCTSLENPELSCGGSRQMSQWNEHVSNGSWQIPSGVSNGTHGVTSISVDRLKHKCGIPLYQRILQNCNMQGYQGFPLVSGSNRSSGSNSQRTQQRGQRFEEAPQTHDIGSQDIDRSGKDCPDRLHPQEVLLASNQRVKSPETHSEPYVPLERERWGEYPTSPAKRYSSARSEDMVGGRNILNEKIRLHEIATEPIAIMAQKLQELPDSFLEGLKELAKETLGSIEKREQFINLQQIIRRRKDLTEETLLHAHRTQLEILVALRTGMQAFVQEGTKLQTCKALIEIFLQTRCRNIDCQQSLLTNGCECKLCSQKRGFCHECMCVVCFKFDSDNDTCRWVGCELCSHWCHTDCGLRMSYIVPIQGAGTSEMQFKCVACGHHSELFGFVKEAFNKCAHVWGAENLAKELDCIRRIFHASEDMRGKQLCWKAEQMLQKIENKVDATEVCRSMLRFLNEGNAELDGARTGTSKQPALLKQNEASDRSADSAREAMFQMTAGNKVPDLNRARTTLLTYDRELEEKRTEAAELQYARARGKAEIEDLESIVRIKQAESKMFQARADEARQDASGLQCIVSAKREKIEGDYTCKYAKLRLHEAEERQRKQFQELQAFERSQRDYQRMKIRMEADIKDLLRKMEMTKRQFV